MATEAAEQAVSLAKDILNGGTKAGWSADWPFEMAQGVLDFEEARMNALQCLIAFRNCTERNGDTCNEWLADALRALGGDNPIEF